MDWEQALYDACCAGQLSDVIALVDGCRVVGCGDSGADSVEDSVEPVRTSTIDVMRRAFFYSCLRGRFAVAQWLWARHGIAVPKSVFVQACGSRHMTEDMLLWLRKRTACALPPPQEMYRFAFRHACGAGNMDVAKVLLKWCKGVDGVGVESPAETPDSDRNKGFLDACGSGNVELAMWLSPHPAPHVAADALVGAAVRGHRDMCQWLLSCVPLGSPELFLSTLRGACHGAMLDTVDWALNVICSRSSGCTGWESGSPTILEVVARERDLALDRGFLDIHQRLAAFCEMKK
jgi:hypothetical protein